MSPILTIAWEQKDGLGLRQEELEAAHILDMTKIKEVVEGMRGMVEYEAQPGKGHILTLRYPHLDFYAAGENPESYSRQMRILVIDPEQNFIDRTFDKYAPLQYIVDEATDSETGLELFKREEVHLTIIDEHMPGSFINGAETIRRIKALDSAACCVMTTFSEEDKVSMQRARELGVIAYYVKPFNLDRLLFSITEARGVLKLRDIVKQWSTLS
jgi:CheY-like chemotaxis protein